MRQKSLEEIKAEKDGLDVLADIYRYACLGFAAIPLFPQAVVPAIFLLTGNHDTKSWFLALYVPAPWPWVVIVAMAALGVSMYTYGGLTYLRAKPARGGSAAVAAD